MGNVRMSTPLGPAPSPVPQTRVFESALASDLQTRVQALVDSFIAGGAGQIVSASIEGAGDGHVFVLTVFYDQDGRPPAVGTLVRVYAAASEPELLLAAAAARASLPVNYVIVAYGRGGSSAGRRWMGALVAEPGLA